MNFLKSLFGVKDPKDQFRYWYSYCFNGVNADGLTINASVYIGYKTHGVNIPRIADAKKSAGVDENAVLYSVCYLGACTIREMEGSEGG